MAEGFKVGDTVKRADGSGPIGLVQNIRIETTRTSLKEDNSSEGPGITVTVLWDNGTVSHFVPNGLEKIGK